MEIHESTVLPAAALDPLILALDAGTSSVRAIVFDATARSVTGWEAHRPYAVTTTPDGGVTADPDALVDLAFQCVDAVLPVVAAAGRDIAAIACDTFWHSLIGVDGRGHAITPVFTWADTRSSQAAQELRSKLDEDAIHARTGTGLHSSYWPAKLHWLRATSPELYRGVSNWMSFGEYLYRRIFGELRVSISMASGTGLLDQNACTWDAELLEVLDLNVNQLSPLADFTDALSAPQAILVRRWPHLGAINWYLAVGDGACNNVGSGGFDQNWVVIMVGTSGALRVVRRADRIDLPRGLWTYRVDRHRFVQGGALSAGGNVFAWLMKTLQITDIETLEKELLKMQPDGHGLTVLPFLAGERSPDWNPNAQAVFLGLTLNSSPLDIVRATLEGITYRFRLVYDILCQSMPRPRGIILSGVGLLHSPAWMQIMTDVMAEPVMVSAVTEATSRGAALLGLEAMGAVTDLSAVPVPVGERRTPNADHSEIYRKALERQEALYGRLLTS